MLPYLSADQLRNALPYPTLIPALRQAFRESIQAPKRHVHTLSEEDATVLLLMPVWQPAGTMGVKLVTVAPANPAKSLPTVHSIFILFDTTTGAPIALLDGEELTLRRTAAASALASTYLSRPDSASLLIIGTGTLAPYLAAAHCVCRPIRTIKVWGRSPDKIKRTIDRLATHDLPQEVVVEAAGDLETAMRSADIISCATTSTEPIVRGAWVEPGTHVDLVGSFTPSMRETDNVAMQRCAVFVDTRAGALSETGDLIMPIREGAIGAGKILAELAELCRGQHAGRAALADAERAVTLFKSVGDSREDLAAAILAFRNQD